MADDIAIDGDAGTGLPRVSWETIRQVAGYCGYFEWEIRWLLDRPAPDLGGGSGGFVLQRVDLRFEVFEGPNPGGRQVSRDEVLNRLGYDREWWHYWEAFKVAPAAQTATQTDTFCMKVSNFRLPGLHRLVPRIPIH